MMSWTKLLEGVAGAEGPIFDRTGRFFLVEPSRHRVLEMLQGGVLREHAHTGGIPAGLMIDGRNDLWVADMQRGILRIDHAAQIHDEVVRFEDAPIRGCNDLIFDGRGHLFFTAPAGSGPDRPLGEVFTRRADGQVQRIDQGMQFPNGISVTPDDSALIVAETHTKRLWRYDLDDQGRVCSPRREWAILPGDHVGGPDGIDFDTDGLLLATNWGGGHLEVFDPQGKLVERVPLPFDKPSNLHFGGPDGRDLYVTEHTHHALWRSRWRTPGWLALPVMP
jgi:gluconolactonase